MSLKGTVLTSTLHDPHGALSWLVPEAAECIHQNFGGWVVNATPSTHESLINALTEAGVYVHSTDGSFYPRDDGSDKKRSINIRIERDHLYALKVGLEQAERQGAVALQYMDGDRILMAAQHFPDEVKAMATEVNRKVSGDHSYATFPRSQNAFLSHHPALVFTEDDLVYFYSRAFNQEIDPGSATHAMSLPVAREIISKSDSLEDVTFPHPKWLFIAHRMGIVPETISTDNVLMFETPEQHRAMLESRYGRHFSNYKDLVKSFLMIKEYDQTVLSTEWSLRLATATQYLQFLNNHLLEIVAEGERQSGLADEITQSLAKIRESELMLTGEFFGRSNLEGFSSRRT